MVVVLSTEIKHSILQLCWLCLWKIVWTTASGEPCRRCAICCCWKSAPGALLFPTLLGSRKSVVSVNIDTVSGWWGMFRSFPGRWQHFTWISLSRRCFWIVARRGEEAEVLQRDLHSLYAWGQGWGMSFNVKKCNIMRITRSRTPITKFYTLGGQILDEVNQAPYLGVLISEELEWAPHINSITSKANSTLGFIRRNLKQCPKDLKELAYMSLVRSKLEYAAGTWDPHHEYNINKLERVQRCAARFVCHDFGPRSSVTQMLSDLGWQQLKDRRKHIRLALLFKIIHDIILVPHQDLLLKADSRTRSSHQFKYRTIRTSTDPYKHSFFPRTIPEWNLLHSDTVNSKTIDQFKSRLLPPPSSSLRPSAASLQLAASVQLAPYCE